MRFDGRLQQATRSSLLIQGVRVCHVVLGPIGSLSFKNIAAPCPLLASTWPRGLRGCANVARSVASLPLITVRGVQLCAVALWNTGIEAKSWGKWRGRIVLETL